MGGRLCLLVLTATLSGYSQVAPSASGGAPTSQMLTPPPVSNAGYSSALKSETRSNYLRGEIAAAAAHVDNMYAGSTGASIAETTVSVNPSIILDSTTMRRQISLAYRPGFVFYSPSSELNEVDHSVSLNYSFRVTPHFSLNAIDQFQDSSMFSGGAVSGSPESTTPGVIIPFARRLTNSASAEATLQTDMNVMIGVSGMSSVLHYPNAAQNVYDSDSQAANAFFNHRLSMAQYCGLNYQFSDTLSYPTTGVSTTQTQTITGYYTFYSKSKLTLSASGGAQHYLFHQPGFPSSSSWGPMLSPSLGWEMAHINLSASYSQLVTGGGGLLGAYHTRSVNTNVRWQFLRTWTSNVSASYSINESVSSAFAEESSDGHGFSGAAALEHTMQAHWNLRLTYTRLQQAYGSIPAIAANPDSNREELSIAWRFERPLGR